jgi:hypothetical protein
MIYIRFTFDMLKHCIAILLLSNTGVRFLMKAVQPKHVESIRSEICNSINVRLFVLYGFGVIDIPTNM